MSFRVQNSQLGHGDVGVVLTCCKSWQCFDGIEIKQCDREIEREANVADGLTAGKSYSGVGHGAVSNLLQRNLWWHEGVREDDIVKGHHDYSKVHVKSEVQ